MKVTYRIPSKKVPYGYIEVEWDKDDNVMPGPLDLAEDYAQYILDYQAAEVQAFENPAARQIKKADKVDTSVADAQKILNEGLGGVSEVDGDDPNAPWVDNPTADAEPDTSTTVNESNEKAQPSDDDWHFS